MRKNKLKRSQRFSLTDCDGGFLRGRTATLPLKFKQKLCFCAESIKGSHYRAFEQEWLKRSAFLVVLFFIEAAAWAIPPMIMDFPNPVRSLPVTPYSSIQISEPVNYEARETVQTFDYSKVDFSTLSRPEIAQQLNWVFSPDAKNVCGGYYTEPLLYYTDELAQPDKELPVRISFDESVLSELGVSSLSGNVVITQPNRQIISDMTNLYRNEEGQFTTADLFGHIDLREPGRHIIGEKGHFNLSDKTGVISNAIYRLTLHSVLIDSEKEYLSQTDTINIEQLSAWGHAKEIIHEEEGVLRVNHGTYTTCPPLTNTWKLKSSEVLLDDNTGRGTAKNIIFYVKDTPVLYAPYFSFPLDDRRQTGLLFPIYGHSMMSGYELALPFYWNIAPNYDATMTPNLMTERGLQLNGEFRYLTPRSYGNVHGSFLPDDRVFANFRKEELERNPPGTLGRNRLKNTSDNRGFISWENFENYSPNWSSYLYLNHVSDDYYFIDFDNDRAQITDYQIINDAALHYNDEHWNFAGHLQGFQTLHPINQAIVSNQYRKLPELILNGNFPDGPFDSIFQINNSFDNFDIRQTNGISVEAPTGYRMNVNPGITLPMYWMSGYITPQIQFAGTQYGLHEHYQKDHDHITRTLPIADVDFGLVFQREVSLFDKEYQQLLEPRLFYLYVPYRNQNHIPLFDTSLQPFSYSQLFRTNRFTGLDRIGDANQISAAITTRFLEQETGEEKLRASIGEIVYFWNRRVNILQLTPADVVTRAITLPRNTPTSPLVAEVNYLLQTNWRFTTGIAWDPNTNITNNANMGLQYKSDKNHIFNLGFNYLRGADPDTFYKLQSSKNDLNQSDISILWPLSEQLYGVARWNYNISHGYTQSAFAGLQYEGCCFAVRLVAGRDLRLTEVSISHKNAHPVFDNRIYLEFVLKGLGVITAESPSKMLHESVMGYEDTLSVM